MFPQSGSSLQLFTIGHGTADESRFAARLEAAGVKRVVDVRRFPGSRRWPWFGASEMAVWLPERGIAYVPAIDLGGRREPLPDSPNVVLRERGFRGYADYMGTSAFRVPFEQLLLDGARTPTAVVCSETLWWRCHRRLIADAAVLLAGAEVFHLVGETRQPHRVTAGARAAGDRVVYDAGRVELA
ncbi:MAG: DUF488 domain-containing protein [Candidatus Elarobacter sp.]